jgi:hypothetical protein
MIRYSDLVQYIKDNHVSWNRDLFDVLRAFFEDYSQSAPLPSSAPVQQELVFEHKEFKEPVDGEYSINDLFDLFNL